MDRIQENKREIEKQVGELTDDLSTWLYLAVEHGVITPDQYDAAFHAVCVVNQFVNPDGWQGSENPLGDLLSAINKMQEIH